MSESVRAILALVAVPLVAILIPAALALARDFSASSRRVRKIEEQNRILAFWENWLRIESSVAIDERPDQKAEEQISEIKRTSAANW